MNGDQNSGEDALVAARPRGANGIPEPTDLDDIGTNGLDFDSPLAFGPLGAIQKADRRPASASHYAEWIAMSAVIGGAVAAIVGCTRQLTAQSRRRAWNAACAEAPETKPHGDKLLPHG